MGTLEAQFPDGVKLLYKVDPSMRGLDPRLTTQALPSPAFSRPKGAASPRPTPCPGAARTWRLIDVGVKMASALTSLPPNLESSPQLRGLVVPAPNVLVLTGTGPHDTPQPPNFLQAHLGLLGDSFPGN